MSLPAISLPSEDLYVLTELGQTRVRHPTLPPLDALNHSGYLALHAADTPPDPDRLEEQARWLGWKAPPGLATPRDRRCVAAMILRPESGSARRSDRRNLHAVDLARLPRGRVVAVAAVGGEERGGMNRTPTWYLTALVVLPEPVVVDTEGWPCFRPWTVLSPALEAVRSGWHRATQRRPALRRGA